MWCFYSQQQESVYGFDSKQTTVAVFIVINQCVSQFSSVGYIDSYKEIRLLGSRNKDIPLVSKISLLLVFTIRKPLNHNFKPLISTSRLFFSNTVWQDISIFQTITTTFNQVYHSKLLSFIRLS